MKVRVRKIAHSQRRTVMAESAVQTPPNDLKLNDFQNPVGPLPVTMGDAEPELALTPLQEEWSSLWAKHQPKGDAGNEKMMAEFMKDRADLSGLPSDFLTSTRARRNQLVLTPEQANIETQPNFKYKDVEKIFSMHPELRDKIGAIPQGISDTKSLLSIAERGADGAEWYEMWQKAIAAHTKGGADARAATMIFALLGKAAPVDANYANFLRVMGRGDHKMMSGNETDTQKFIDSKLGKFLGQTQQSAKTFSQAFRGEVPSENEIRKLLDYMMSFLGQQGIALDEWMNRMMYGSRNDNDTAPTERNYDAMYGRVRHLTMMANAKKMAGKNDWTIWQMQAAMWVGYRRMVADYLQTVASAAEGGDKKAVALVNDLRNLSDTLTSSATPEKIMGQFGMSIKEDGKATDRPNLNVHNIMGKKLEQLIEAAGTFRIRDLQNLNIKKNPEMVKELASAISGIQVLPPDSRNKAWRVRGERNDVKELIELVSQHNANAATEADKAELAGYDTLTYKGRDMESPIWTPGGEEKLDKLMSQDGLGHDLATIRKIRDTRYNIPGEEYWKDIGPNAEYMSDRATKQGFSPSQEDPKLLLSATREELTRVAVALINLSERLDQQGNNTLADVFTDHAVVLAHSVSAKISVRLTSGDARRVLSAVNAMNSTRKIRVQIR